jgi:hypothetical protein
VLFCIEHFQTGLIVLHLSIQFTSFSVDRHFLNEFSMTTVRNLHSFLVTSNTNNMPWQDGRYLVWDVTCSDTLAVRYIAKAVLGPGLVASDAEMKMCHKYSTLNTAGYTFYQ